MRILKIIIVLITELCIVTSVATAMPLPSGISFYTNWEHGINGPANWNSIQIVANDRFQTVTSPFQYGRPAVRVEVRHGDDPINSSGERAEVLIMTDEKGNHIN